MSEAAQSLTAFVSSLSGGDGLRVEERLGSGYVRLRVAEAERRQARHDIRCVEDAILELLRNARDAGARRIFCGLMKEDRVRQVFIADDGCGIPHEMWERIFDARVTSKLDTMVEDRWGVHGRGMALYSIRERSLTSRVVASTLNQGTMIHVAFDTSVVGERKDQSTWPTLCEGSGKATLTGPQNIIRTCVEFAFECPDTRVYVGSPSEMIATMRKRLTPTTGEGGPIMGPTLALDARQLREAASGLGVELSERTCYRIMTGQVAPLRHAALKVSAASGGQAAPYVRPRQRLVLTEDDRTKIADALTREVADVCSRYFANVSGQARVTVADGRITVSVPIAQED